MTTGSVQTFAVPGLSFTPEELAQRRQTLGASEIPAVAGLHPKRTPLDVFAEKRGLVPPFAGNEYTEWGLRLEGAIRQKYIEVTGHEVVVPPKNMVAVHADWMSASPDGLLAGELGLEIKRFGEHRTDDFGPAGTDQVPVDVAAQAHWGMMVTELDRWDVAVLLGQADFRIYHLHFDEEIADNLHDIGKRFWFDHVLTGVEPPITGDTASHKYLQQKFQTYRDILLPATDDTRRLAALLAQVKKELRALEQEESTLEAQLKLAIGNAAGIEGLCTWKAPRSGYVSWKDVAHTLAGGKVPADLVAKHTGEATRRFLLTYKG